MEAGLPPRRPQLLLVLRWQLSWKAEACLGGEWGSLETAQGRGIRRGGGPPNAVGR